MQRFAVIDVNSGYVWAVVDAANGAAACAAADAFADSHTTAGSFERTSRSDIHRTYAVYEAPAGFDVDDGQDREQIAAVESLGAPTFFKRIA